MKIRLIAEKPKAAKDEGKKKKSTYRRKNSKKNEADEAIEESDEGDYDDREVDYITDPSRLVDVWTWARFWPLEFWFQSLRSCSTF